MAPSVEKDVGDMGEWQECAEGWYGWVEGEAVMEMGACEYQWMVESGAVEMVVGGRNSNHNHTIIMIVIAYGNNHFSNCNYYYEWTVTALILIWFINVI